MRLFKIHPYKLTTFVNNFIYQFKLIKVKYLMYEEFLKESGESSMKLEITKQQLFIFLIALFGLIVSVELCYIYFNANFVPNAGASFCRINEFIDCDAVAKTSFSVFLGVPLSVYGVFYYLFIMFLALFPFAKFDFFKTFKNPVSYIFTLSSLSVLSSVILGIISSVVIHKICLLCYVLYGVNFILFILSKFGKSFVAHYKNTFKDLIDILRDKTWLLIVIISVMFAISALAAINITQVFKPAQDNDVSAQDNSTSNENPYKVEGNILGAEHPRIVISEYTDFQCPYCSISNSMMHRLVSEVDGVRVEHHDFPLNKECNSMVKTSAHKFSCKAAYYARAAKKQGKYWEYIDLLFDNQQNLSEAKFIELAKSINLDIEKLKKDANSQEVKNEVQEDVNRAKSLNIQATPTYFIGIRKYEGLMPYPELQDIVYRSLQ